MTIETKFNIDDTVWFIHNSIIKNSDIYRIRAEYLNTGNNVYEVITVYYLSGGHELRETSLYSTKEEAGLTWLKTQGLDCGLKDSE